jgi:hypothetical protein
VVAGDQEGKWELVAGRAIWSSECERMFEFAQPDCAASFGLFSGGGQSMQVVDDGAARSFPFSTWSEELDERKNGGEHEAWRDAAKWAVWTSALQADVEAERAKLGSTRFGGSYVLTAMNEVACKAASLSETPVRAASAVAALRAAFGHFYEGSGDAYATFLEERKHFKYNVARVTAMHLYRLALVLELLFEPDARLFAPDARRKGVLHCEWALGAFCDELKRLRERRASTAASFLPS